MRSRRELGLRFEVAWWREVAETGTRDDTSCPVDDLHVPPAHWRKRGIFDRRLYEESLALDQRVC